MVPKTTHSPVKRLDRQVGRDATTCAAGKKVLATDLSLGNIRTRTVWTRLERTGTERISMKPLRLTLTLLILVAPLSAQQESGVSLTMRFPNGASRFHSRCPGNRVYPARETVYSLSEQVLLPCRCDAGL
jgi:hypothetical protein